MKKLLGTLALAFIFTLLLTGCDNKNKNIVEINLEEFKQKISNKESFALYVGNKDCTHCVSYRPILEQVLEDYKITIYQLDNSKLSSSEYAEFRKYVNISGTPTVAFIEDGEEETTLNRISGEATREQTIERFKTNGYIK
ncbi:MAG: thioredoxin family protein [Bacilli bacterium]|nr:thioredoxin family protein [Bacilli bacterium]